MSEVIQKEIEEGREAAALLEHPVLASVLAEMTDAPVKVFLDPAASPEQVAAARGQAVGAGEVKRILRARVSRGERRRLELEKAERDEELRKNPTRRISRNG